MSLRSKMRYMNPYDVHKALINEYILKRPGDTKVLQRDKSKDKTDFDVLRDNHKFLWDETECPETWEERFAKRYYDKLFKEYCIGDLSLYKENKVALRWRTEKEVVFGKGQFVCGNKKCDEKERLKSWEVNFAYVEQGEKRNALVKIRLCEDCSKKLNYKTKKREVKRLKANRRKSDACKPDEVNLGPEGPCTSAETTEVDRNEPSLWANLKPVEVKTREEEIEDYLEDLLM